MNRGTERFSIAVVIVFLIISFEGIVQGQGYIPDPAYERSDFEWPSSKQMGLSLTFDDGRLTQVDNGMALFDRYGIKATFYVSLENLLQRVPQWKEAVRKGHDIGNHSLQHPCTVNYGWAPEAQLENYDLERMGADLDSAGVVIKSLLGIGTVSFAYPCGQTFVGTGVNTKSYIPLIASRFESGRLWLSERPVDPKHCDLAQLPGMELDGKTFDQIKELIDYTKSRRGWLILAGHEISDTGNQESFLSTIEAICKYASDPANGIWIDNVHNIAAYIRQKRGESFAGRLLPYRDPVYSTTQRVEDLLSRMTLEEKVGQLNMPGVHATPFGADSETRIRGCGNFIRGTMRDGVGPGGGLMQMREIICPGGPEEQAILNNDMQKIAITQTRLGIPLLMIDEAPHGLLAPGATIFPEGLSVGSTWNKDLVRELYSAVASEARSTGSTHICTLVIEPNRDPRMGRNCEGFSEDPWLCSAYARAIVRGVQGNDISRNDKAVPVLCHFPGQTQPVGGLENGEQEMSERTLKEVFLPPWEAGISESGGLAVMATYPSINGIPVHSSDELLTSVLRGDLGFRGIVLSEGGGISELIRHHIASSQQEAGSIALRSGVDAGISFEDAWLDSLTIAVREGKVNMSLIDRAVRRILTQKFELGLFEHPYVNSSRAGSVVHSEKHQELALQVAREGVVLLKNKNNLLPVNRNVRSIAVIGPNADDEINQLGDYTSVNIPDSQEIISVLEGIRSRAGKDTRVSYVKGCEVTGTSLNEIRKAEQAARRSDLAVVVVGESVGYTNPVQTVGEHNDISSLALTGMQEELVKAVCATGTPTIVVLINGRPLSIGWIAENVPAVIEAWFCGEKGGLAIADVIFGDYNPSGRLPVTIPRNAGQLPYYYNYRHSRENELGRAYADASALPLYDFGFGLSYTNFTYNNLEISPKENGVDGDIMVSLDVTNTGKRSGTEVVQLYLSDEKSTVTRPVKELKGCAKTWLEPGQTERVSFVLHPSDLAIYDRNMKRIVEPGRFNVLVGHSSGDISLKGTFTLSQEVTLK
jgi:beta-glucosidase